MKKYVDVILPLPLNGTYTYAVPDDLSLSVEAGCRVVVDDGRLVATGTEDIHTRHEAVARRWQQ